MDTIWNDLVYAARRLHDRPLFTAGAAILLAFGLGLNAISFSVLDAFVLRPLPVANPERLIQIQSGTSRGFSDKVSYAEYQIVREELKSADGVTPYQTRGGILKSDGLSEAIPAGVVSRDHFRFLGVRAVAGAFASFEQSSRADPVAVISHSLWQRRFQAKADLAGSTISFNGMNVRIAAIAEPDYRGLDIVPADIWFDVDTWATVSNSEGELQDPGQRIQVWAKLAEGVHLNVAQAQLDAAARRFASEHPEVQPARIMKAFLYSASMTRRAGLAAALFGPFAIVVMLIPCANVLGLLLIQAHARQREMAIRTAIGASRRRVLRQLMTESALLASLGTALGLLFAGTAIRLIPAMMPALPIAVNFDFRIDDRTFIFSASLAFFVVMLCGVVPLRQATANLQPALTGAGNVPGRARGNLNHLVVVSQIAASLVLLTMSTLLYRSYAQTLNVDAGFKPSANALFLFTMPPINDTPSARADYYRQLQDRVDSMAGVTASAMCTTVPFPMEGGGANREIWLPGKMDPSGPPATVRFNGVQPAYFDILGMRFMLGGPFAPEKKQLVINETMARRYWGTRNPLGETIRIGGREGDEYEITGVVTDGKYGSIHEPAQPYMFLPHNQVSFNESQLAIRFNGNVNRVRQELRDTVLGLSPDAALLSMLTLEEHYQRGLYVDRLIASSLAAFSAAGIALAAIGLYSALAFIVRLKEQELAVRIAIGAHPQQILAFVLKQGLRLTAFGILAGLPLALLASRAIRGLLYGVGLDNALSLGAIVLAMILVMAMASWIPARHASRIPSAEILRR
jgi:predicted permease